MSRSWERKVRKNMSKVNKDRKKNGTSQLVLNTEKNDKFTGRNIMAPILLVVFVLFFSTFQLTVVPDYKPNAMFWVTLSLYIGLAVLLYYRKPYFTIGKDYVQSRRFRGDKRLAATAIKGFRFQNGYVTVIPQKGAPWTFSRMLNRYDTNEMTQKVKVFAGTHNITFEEK